MWQTTAMSFVDLSESEGEMGGPRDAVSLVKYDRIQKLIDEEKIIDITFLTEGKRLLEMLEGLGRRTPNTHVLEIVGAYHKGRENHIFTVEVDE